MSADDTTELLVRSLEQQTRRVHASPRPDDLFRRLERRSARGRRIATAAAALALVVGVSAGYLVSELSSPDPTDDVSVATLDDGRPADPTPDPALLPNDVGGAISAIGTAFHDAFDGGVAPSSRVAATQRGAELVPLWEQSRATAQRFGYTTEQLAGTQILVRDTTFIDDTHAVVRFDLSIPEHGRVMVDRVGYAVFSEGRWKVSLRTACDILSLNGTTRTCPLMR